MPRKTAKLRGALIGMVLSGALGATAQGVPPGNRPGQAGSAPALRQKPSAAIPMVPPTAPTSQPTPPVVPQATKVISTVRRARVDYRDGLVTVTADDSSLNQILHEIARQTGLKITGGVADERVYGTYGPAELEAVLATLLDGTGSNMLLSQSAPDSPMELILTARGGGPTPPTPGAGENFNVPDRREDLPPQLTPRTSNVPSYIPQLPVYPPEPMPFAPPADATPAGTTPAPDAAPPAGTTTDQAPNGVRTPQQIYDQLMKMQQQQQKPPAPQ